VNVGNEDEQSPLLKILRLEAPAIDLIIKPVTRIDLAEQIDLGRIDVAIGVFSDPPSRFRTSLLFEYDDVLIVGGKRKLGRIDNAALARMPLVVVSFRRRAGGRHRRLHLRARSRQAVGNV
jgi:DNA-binding transcriptional LysR family regulator